MHNPLCISVVSTAGYHEYIPFYIYYILKAYPQYSVFVYHDGKVPKEIYECLELIKDIGNFKLKPIPYKYISKDQNIKSIRWILYDEEFTDFEYLYIGDIDMFIVNEFPSLLNLHIDHSNEIGKPYSNIVRDGVKKLTGLHFMHVKDYFKEALPVINKYKSIIETSSSVISNETILYNIIKESVGLPEIRGNFVTHHGIHMRCFNSYNPLSYQRGRDDYPFKMLFEKYYREFYYTAKTDIVDKFFGILSNIDYRTNTMNSEAGASLYKQFNNVIKLCEELKNEQKPTN